MFNPQGIRNCTGAISKQVSVIKTKIVAHMLAFSGRFLQLIALVKAASVQGNMWWWVESLSITRNESHDLKTASKKAQKMQACPLCVVLTLRGCVQCNLKVPKFLSCFGGKISLLLQQVLSQMAWWYRVSNLYETKLNGHPVSRNYSAHLCEKKRILQPPVDTFRVGISGR